MNWSSVVAGAQVGAAIGAATGLVPLGVGYLCQEKRKAIAGFFGCMLGGAVGGLYAAIAVMVAAIAQIVQLPRQPGERKTQWSGLATVADKLWYLVATCWLFICMFGTMFVFAAFLTPLVLGVPNSAPRDSIGKFVEPMMLFGGLGLGIVLGLVGVSFISRRFISSTTHTNWAKDFEISTLNRSRLMQKVARCFLGLLLPRDWRSLKEQ